MMGAKKRAKTNIMLLFVLAATFIAFLVLNAQTEKTSPFGKRQRPSVNFFDEYHDSHMENRECLECHHKYEDNENVQDEDELQDALEESNPEILCSSCHDSSSKLGLQKAFHHQCLSCHDKVSKSGQKAGPMLCGECHIRKQ